MFKKEQRSAIAKTIIAVIIFALGISYFANNFLPKYLGIPTGKETIADRISEYEDEVANNLKPLFDEKKEAYPPKHVTLLLIKDQKKLYLYAGSNQFNVKYIKNYSVRSSIDTQGPKLRENDRQLPEGIYEVSSLYPVFKYHIGLQLNYPNSFDLEKAAEDNRKNIDAEVFIGATAAWGVDLDRKDVEELFVLAAKSNYKNWKVVLAPTDFRVRKREPSEGSPSWISELDQKLLHAFLLLP